MTFPIRVRRGLLTLIIAALLLPTLPPVQADPGPFAVELAFESVPQGGVGVVSVQGAAVAGARTRFLNHLTDFYETDDGWYGLLAVSMDQNPGTYPVEVFVWFEDGSRTTWEGEVTVTDAGFIRQDINLSGSLSYLLEPELDRGERMRLMAIFNRTEPVHYWDGAFIPPTESEFTSPFGAWRLYNESLWARHTGVDMRSPMGMPIVASAGGEVVLAERLDIRGNYVLIDHGMGVYSGYAHLSEIHVTPGQVLRQGQVVGVSGNTGRSGGPHLHWEIAVNGEWVDPEQFLTVEAP